MSLDDHSSPPEPVDCLLHISGTVQGVGFRPFISRLAHRHQLTGWVRNDSQGVTICLLCTKAQREAFAGDMLMEAPPASRIERIRIEELVTSTGRTDRGELPEIETGKFRIIKSSGSETTPAAAVTPDLAICPACLGELRDPSDRRYRYPFINCTNCGPRYSILNSLPYDRARTTMANFEMCPKCSREYTDALDRRFHAQPNACAVCGPAVHLLDMEGRVLAVEDSAVTASVEALLRGDIVAVKGLGGFHLFADARNEKAVSLLRHRKHRDAKPFAVMFPSLPVLRQYASATPEEEKLLTTPAAPIVLIKKLQGGNLAPSIAPGNPWIGTLLPYTPLHVLLMDALAIPVVATSANLSDEPLCTDNDEAVVRLRGIADAVLLHNRPIARPVDDSVQRIAERGALFLRRARGYAPSPLLLPDGMDVKEPLLAVGGHLKSTVSVSLANQVVVSPHIGDLSNTLSIETFQQTIDLLLGLYGGKASKVACDLHPDYVSTRIAESMGLPIVRVQHHLAHILACLLEHGGGPGRVLGVVWDGTGYGEDGTIWGGEFITVDREAGTARRVAHMRPFPLPGGDQAIRRPGRSALGALYSAELLDSILCQHALGAALCPKEDQQAILTTAIRQQINSPATTSAGRLFDAVAALLGLCTENSFEGQAGMSVEFAAANAMASPPRFNWNLRKSTIQENALEVDWGPMLEEICSLKVGGSPDSELALCFHRTLAGMILEVARTCDISTVVLSGGCFQNVLLTELAHDMLVEGGFKVLLHHQLPPNDNAISAGQALGMLWNITRVKLTET